MLVGDSRESSVVNLLSPLLNLRVTGLNQRTESETHDQLHVDSDGTFPEHQEPEEHVGPSNSQMNGVFPPGVRGFLRDTRPVFLCRWPGERTGTGCPRCAGKADRWVYTPRSFTI